VRTGRSIGAFLALAAASLAALALPAALPAQEPGAAPAAVFTASQNPVPAGGVATFDASRSSDAGGHIVSYRWDLDGDGTFEADTGDVPRTSATYPQPGTVRVGLRVVDDRGATDEAFVDVTADARPQPASAAAPGAPPARPKRERAAAAPRISAAASTSVTISDFKFAPAGITVSVGDTVTWANHGPTAHTATARDGSFDTGIVNRGRSGSHRFTKAGTFAYVCTLHPFMHGTVTVAAAGSSGGSSGGGSTSSAGTPPAGSAGSTASSGASGGSLPNTGLALASLLFTGAGMIAAGVTLRLALARRSRAL
jgi:plastocyanin